MHTVICIFNCCMSYSQKNCLFLYNHTMEIRTTLHVPIRNKDHSACAYTKASLCVLMWSKQKKYVLCNASFSSLTLSDSNAFSYHRFAIVSFTEACDAMKENLTFPNANLIVSSPPETHAVNLPIATHSL